jgi:hypothetical protein
MPGPSFPGRGWEALAKPALSRRSRPRSVRPGALPLFGSRTAFSATARSLHLFQAAQCRVFHRAPATCHCSRAPCTRRGGRRRSGRMLSIGEVRFTVRLLARSGGRRGNGHAPRACGRGRQVVASIRGFRNGRPSLRPFGVLQHATLACTGIPSGLEPVRSRRCRRPDAQAGCPAVEIPGSFS